LLLAAGAIGGYFLALRSVPPATYLSADSGTKAAKLPTDSAVAQKTTPADDGARRPTPPPREDSPKETSPQTGDESPPPPPPSAGDDKPKKTTSPAADDPPKKAPTQGRDSPKPVLPGGDRTPMLLYKPNLQYVGAFRTPNYYDSVDEMSFTQGVLAYRAANNSLFICGHKSALCEIAIPSSIVNSDKLADLATAEVVQKWHNVLGQIPKPLSAEGNTLFGGLLIADDKLIGTVFKYYEGANSQRSSHFVVNSLKLSKATVGGTYSVGDPALARSMAGFMCPVPSEWQTAFGAPCLTGQADIPIISTTSNGPAAFGFDPKKLGSGETPATSLLYYPIEHALAPYDHHNNPIQSGNSSITGVVFVPGTRSILFIGRTGTNYNGYGKAEDYGDAVETYSPSPHSLNGEYAFQVWAYDANELASVKKGKMRPWEVQPYCVWNFTVPLGGHDIGGAAYDPKTGRLYLSLLRLDQEAQGSALPVIAVFQVNLEPTGKKDPAAPEIGALAITPKDLAPGPVAAGKEITLTAGNVYAFNQQAKVKQVKFYLDSPAGKLLGAATAGSAPNTRQNWTLAISTKDLTPGSYKICAQATDSEGVVSDPVTTTLQIRDKADGK
jgi:hypothetical protein